MQPQPMPAAAAWELYSCAQSVCCTCEQLNLDVDILHVDLDIALQIYASLLEGSARILPWTFCTSGALAICGWRPAGYLAGGPRIVQADDKHHVRHAYVLSLHMIGLRDVFVLPLQLAAGASNVAAHQAC